MAVAALHKALLDALTPRMAGWKFVAAHRHFKRQAAPGTLWFVHLTFINHVDDFDAVVDVAVQFMRRRESVCVVGAQLGNIAGVGQTRFRVARAEDVPAATEGILAEFASVGLPFLERFSRPDEVVAVLRRGGREADLISPLSDRHERYIRGLEAMIAAGEG